MTIALEIPMNNYYFNFITITTAATTTTTATTATTTTTINTFNFIVIVIFTIYIKIKSYYINLTLLNFMILMFFFLGIKQCYQICNKQ